MFIQLYTGWTDGLTSADYYVHLHLLRESTQSKITKEFLAWIHQQQQIIANF